MYLKECLEKYKDKKIKMYIDMDGVIADYIVVDCSNYDKKRPLYSSIKKLEEISKNENIELYILSISRMDIGVNEKNLWLDKYITFIKKENRIIISRESNNFKKSSELKSEYLRNVKREDDTYIIVIDDDPTVLEKIMNENKDIILFKDTVLVD